MPLLSSDGEAPSGKPRASVPAPVSGVGPGRTYRELTRIVLGLGLLYASGYYLPIFEKGGRYFLRSDDLVRVILLPSLVAILTTAAAIYAGSLAAKRLRGRWLTPITAILGLTWLGVIALKGLISAAGYDWEAFIPLSPRRQAEQDLIKIAALVLACSLLWITRTNIWKQARLLSSLGLAFGALAAVRLIILWHQSHLTSEQSIPASSPAAESVAANSIVRPRRVVWVIFDETDYNRAFHPDDAAAVELPHFYQLASVAVSASNANSPASATLYSIPALLTGLPVSSRGIQIDESANLFLEQADGRLIAFNDATSIFGKLAARGQSASVLGFYHPYCRLFRLKRCDAFPSPDVGSLDAAIWSNVPDFIANKIHDPWVQITENSLDLLPQYLAREDALTFIHLNVPHLPATYADKILHLAASSNPQVEYTHNLRLADQILGQIIVELVRQSRRHELLLVVSTDHWLRNAWFAPGLRDASRPVPFIAWRVGDAEGYAMSQPLSTVHTTAMILNYLDGHLTSQADIAQWWANQSVIPTFIAPTK